jgi:hypothetical protein
MAKNENTPAHGGKKKLTEAQEFEIMKLVLDKFLWLGFGIMAAGLLMILFQVDNIFKGFMFMIVGAIVLVLFMMLLIREYEIMK